MVDLDVEESPKTAVAKLNFQECTLNAEEAKYKNGCVNWNQYYTKCTTGPTNPFNGAISFDNIGLAWVAIFLVISLEGWTDVMYFVQVGSLTRPNGTQSIQ